MNIWTIKEICKILDIEKIKSKINFSGISIDSRTIKKEIFIFTKKEKTLMVMILLMMHLKKGLLPP